jgi:hypothetical protein
MKMRKSTLRPFTDRAGRPLTYRTYTVRETISRPVWMLPKPLDILQIASLLAGLTGFCPGLAEEKPLCRLRFTAVKHSFSVIMCDKVL